MRNIYFHVFEGTEGNKTTFLCGRNQKYLENPHEHAKLNVQDLQGSFILHLLVFAHTDVEGKLHYLANECFSSAAVALSVQ